MILTEKGKKDEHGGPSNNVYGAHLTAPEPGTDFTSRNSAAGRFPKSLLIGVPGSSPQLSFFGLPFTCGFSFVGVAGDGGDIDWVRDASGSVSVVAVGSVSCIFGITREISPTGDRKSTRLNSSH